MGMMMTFMYAPYSLHLVIYRYGMYGRTKVCISLGMYRLNFPLMEIYDLRLIYFVAF